MTTAQDDARNALLDELKTALDEWATAEGDQGGHLHEVGLARTYGI